MQTAHNLQIKQLSNNKSSLMSTKNMRLRQMTFNQTFQSSLVQQNKQKFAIDKSLINGIKQNDVNKIIEQTTTPQPAQSPKQQYNEIQQISEVIIDTRERYDELKTISKKCQQDIEKLLKTKQILLEDHNKYKQFADQQKKQLEQTNKRCEQVMKLLEEIQYQRDTYLNTKDNVKYDVIVLKKRYFDRDVKLIRDNTRKKLLKSQYDSKVKLSRNCRQVLLSVQKTVQVRQIERAQQIKSVLDLLNKKQATIQQRQLTKRQIESVTILGMTQKLPKQKQWIKMLKANLLLKNILKSKMERFMSKYNKVQLCFHRIKQSTSIKDANQFIERFLHREQTYQSLLQTIEENQIYLDGLKKQHTQLTKINKGLIFKAQQIVQQLKKSNPKAKTNNNNCYKTIQFLNEQLMNISRQKQGIYQWGSKFLAAFYGQPTREKVVNKYPKEKTKQLFIQILKTINKFTTELQTQQKIQQILLKDNPKQFTITGQISQKNTRIKTLTTYQNQKDQDNFQDQHIAYDNLSELDYLQYSRKAIKKNDMHNRKFRIKTKPN